MSITQFLRIFWARRNIILAATFACLIGGILVGFAVPARWQAHARVLLDLIKPDPVTGATIGGNGARYYIQAQTEMVTDPNVVGRIAEVSLDPERNEAPMAAAPGRLKGYEDYKAKAKGPVQSEDAWIAHQIIPSIQATVLQGSNILDIEYTAPNARSAVAIVSAIRQAYIDASLEQEKIDATNNADWFEKQAGNAKVAMNNAVAAKIAYERATGVVLQDNNQTVDAARLQTLANGGGTGSAGPVAPVAVNPADATLAQVDSQIAAESKILGPNHPEMIALKARRSAVAAAAALEQKKLSAASQAAEAARAGIGVLSDAVNAQKTKVLAEGGAEQTLRQLQTDIDVSTDEYNKSKARASQLRETAGVKENDLTPLGPPIIDAAPVFPNWPLIIAGSLGLGIALGVVISFLVELFGRRVRGPEDLAGALDSPVLALIASAGNDNRNGRSRKAKPALQRVAT